MPKPEAKPRGRVGGFKNGKVVVSKRSAQDTANKKSQVGKAKAKGEGRTLGAGVKPKVSLSSADLKALDSKALIACCRMRKMTC